MGVSRWRPSWIERRHYQEADEMLSAAGFPTRHIDLPELGAAPSVPPLTSDKSKPVCTYLIMTVHVLVAIALLWVSEFEFSDLSLVPPVRIQNWIGAQQSYVYSGEYWRLASGIWLHSSLIQFALTVLALFRAGSDIELEHGPVVFTSLYLLSSLGGAMTSVIFSYPHQPGACSSGGVFGLFASDMAYFVHNYYQLGGRRWRYISVSMILPTIGLILGLHPMINNYAHIGGFIAGLFVSMAMLSQFQTVRGQPWLRYNRKTLTVVCIFTGLSILLFALLITGLIARRPSPCAWCHYANCVPFPWWTCPQPNIP